MDLVSAHPKYYQAPIFTSNDMEQALEGKASIYGNSFADTIADPLCELNLKETSEFVKSLPMSSNKNTEPCRGILDVQYQRKRDSHSILRRMEAPPTPGRPIFGFSVPRKSVPSKWDDAEKWLVSSSCHESPAAAHVFKPSEYLKVSKQCYENFKQPVVADFVEEKVSNTLSGFQGSLCLDHLNSAGAFSAVSSGSIDVPLKDKFTYNGEPILPNLRYSEPLNEGFRFRTSAVDSMQGVGTKVIEEVQHRDAGTEMTPIGSSTTSRCHTPFKSSSPARHNTPANRSGPLASGNSMHISSTIDIAQLQECHLAKLQQGTQYDSVTSNWSSREEEEEDVSKSLRHSETGIGLQKSVSESRAAAWEDEEKTKCCLRYQREEAKIQAWVNLQTAKAEAQTKKLEVKIQKMRSNLEEKLMKRMAAVHRKAEDWRSAAQQQHLEHMRKASEQALNMINRVNQHSSGTNSCGCFPCNNLH